MGYRLWGHERVRHNYTHTHTHTHTHARTHARTPDFPAGKPRLKPFYASQQSSGRGTETRREATGPQKQVLGGAQGRRQVEGPGGGTQENKRTGHWQCVPSSSFFFNFILFLNFT